MSAPDYANAKFGAVNPYIRYKSELDHNCNFPAIVEKHKIPVEAPFI